MKDGSRSKRSLVLTGCALIEVPAALKRDFRVTATRALVAIRPSEVKEVLLACRFRGKLSLKLDQTNGFLLHCDRFFLLIFTIYYSIFAELRV
jgi:hypothetical protein